MVYKSVFNKVKFEQKLTWRKEESEPCSCFGEEAEEWYDLTFPKKIIVTENCSPVETIATVWKRWYWLGPGRSDGGEKHTSYKHNSVVYWSRLGLVQESQLSNFQEFCNPVAKLLEAWIGHIGSIYTTKIGKRYKSAFFILLKSQLLYICHLTSGHKHFEAELNIACKCKRNRGGLQSFWTVTAFLP